MVRAGAQEYEEKPGFILPEEIKLSGASYCYLQLPDGQVQKVWSHSILRGEWICDKRQKTQARTCKIPTND